MSNEKNIKDEKKKNLKIINPKIIESISSLNTDIVLHSESCPSYLMETFNVIEKLNDDYFNKEKEVEYKIGNYLIKKTLGQGTFGKVKLGIYLPSQEKVAIKILEKDRIIEKDDKIRLKREFDMLSLFNHPNVILVIEIFENPQSYFSVMEYCEGGELFNYILKNHRLSNDESAFFYYQLINGLEYIHTLGIVHRDLKPENLLLTNEHLLKIIDFGLSNYFEKDQKNLLSTPCGSPCYASPEMVGGKKYNGFKIDIWSTGIILFAMLCGYLPFEDNDNEILFEKILECKIILPNFISENAKDLIEKILVIEPDKRISIPEIKKHPFYLKGKEIFEQEFSIFQITKDINHKTSIVENIDINKILDNHIYSKINKDKIFIENEKEEEKFSEENIIKEMINLQKENKNKDDFNNQETSEEIELINLEDEMEKNEENEINSSEKQILDNKENKVINKEIEEVKDNCDKIKDKKIEGFELEQNNFIQNLNTEYFKKRNLRNKIIFPVLKEKNNTECKIENIKKNNSKNKKVTNSAYKKNEKNENKNVTLIKNKDFSNNIRRKLIKNKHKLNIRINSQAARSTKNHKKLLNHRLKNNLNHSKNRDISSKSKRIKNNNKNLFDKRSNNANIFKEKMYSIENIKQRNLLKIDKINNTIENDNLQHYIKLHSNFQKDSINSIKGKKKTKSATKSEVKINSYEFSKIKKIKKKKSNNMLDKNNSSKKYLNSNIIRKLDDSFYKKYKLLHRKNLKIINYNLKNNNNIFVKENEKKILKEEKNKNKGNKNNLFEIKNINSVNINLGNIDNSLSNNINIRKVSKDLINDNNKKSKQSKQRIYNSKINIKKIINTKIYSKNVEMTNKLNNDKYIIKTFDNIKYNKVLRNNLNNYGKMSESQDNVDHSYEMKLKKNVDVENKIPKINLEGIKLSNTIKNYIIHPDKKKNIKRYTKKKGLSNKTDIFDRKNFIKMDYINKRNNFRNSQENHKSQNLNKFENYIKTESNKNYCLSKISILNSLDYDTNKSSNKEINKKLSQAKLASHHIYKNSKNKKIISNRNKIQGAMIGKTTKNSNNTSNSSNFNSFIRNPFSANESNTFDNISPFINFNSNYIQGSNNINKKHNNSKNKSSQITINKNKKKSFVTIRNTVINLNMIDSKLFLASINKKKNSNKKNKTICQNNSVNRLHNNHLSRLCSNIIKNFPIRNHNIKSIGNNNLSLKTKSINNSRNNDLIYNNKKTSYNFENININKNYSKIINRKYMNNNQDKIHMKYNSMKLENFYGLKKNKKNINISNYSINKNKLIKNEQKQFNTINNEGIIYNNKKDKHYILKEKK